jgi:hypothetical protein
MIPLSTMYVFRCDTCQTECAGTSARNARRYYNAHIKQYGKYHNAYVAFTTRTRYATMRIAHKGD